MDLITCFILLLIVIALIILFVARPLTSSRQPVVEGSQVLSTLLAEYDRVLNSLKELDFDNSLGKIPPEVYPVQRANLVQQGAELLRKIDQLAPVLEVVPSLASTREDQVEAILTARRTKQATTTVTSDDEVEKLLAWRRKTRSDKPSVFCSQCGKPLSNSENYCPNCGHPIQ
ncbi:MAG: zinc ribbon domain-containing protein [Anaerolineales bacterium]|jgi:rubrerythrin